MSFRYTTETAEELAAAGWFPGRSVEVGPLLSGLDMGQLNMHAAARSFLTEYGGLALTPNGPGVNRARQHFTLNPSLCSEEEDRFLEWGEVLGKTLFPVGEFDYGAQFLAIDEDGEIYLAETWLASFGKMPEAMEGMVAGVMPEILRER